MECPHLFSEECVKINRDFVRKQKIEISAATSTSKTWRCLECASMKENWMCLNCGTVLCGRYENCHALKHSTYRNDHKICMSTINFSVFCYKCDDFIVNDTKDRRLDELRQELSSKDDDSASETSTTTSSSSSTSSGVEDPASSGKYQQELTSTSSSSDSGWEEMPLGRKLRPRKRTISSDSSENAKRKSLRKVVGLRNLGNTCFMNSVLQSLSNIHEFSCYFSALPAIETAKQKRFYHSRSLKENVDDANVVEELRKVLLNLSQGGDGSKAISPECLFLVIWKVVPQFRGHRQHDAHEFLRYMLDRLHTELQQISLPDAGGGGVNISGKTAAVVKCHTITSTENSSTSSFKGRSSIVTSVFGGTLQSEVRCLICGMESKKHDPFLDLSLDIPEKFYKECDEDNQPVCNISDCLSSFTEIEELAETELYYCSSCKCKQKSTKRFWIRRLPNVLCLHIKRFRWSNFFRTKIDLRISFPINSLDMSQFVLNNGPETRRSNSSNNVYDLAAVIVHHGNGSSCGHYTSFAINNGTWLHFNDHTVKEVPPSAVADCKPYILFYIRRDSSKNS
ncbi:ubiquitin carboxyl-terminal hydrolase 3-like [Phlebotomus papatasi]|uniref:ubiquitin carboxyl-terminal hydrolase 3-like n=1 Tax=Phlebotomus papatasi TaxID=29031 RepID=UPI0024842D66|nr:ubiquitin carboxyl-terminal hydrolase 3-like [Phlebotomus papatasi]